MGDPKEKNCAICGKEIYAGEDWAYKRRIHGERTLWFCSYKHMREYDAKTEGPKKARTETEAPPAPPKEPTSRAEQAKALAREILAGRSVIAWLKKEGYKNPNEAYSAVRHYAQTKMPELAETLKPLKDLPKAPPAVKTGRPRKPRPVMERVDLVPEVDPDPEPVQCIAHVTDAELAEAEEPEKVEPFLHIYSKDDLLRIVDEATLDCQQVTRQVTRYRWTSDSLEREMFNKSQLNAEGIGMMKLRRQIRKKLGVEDGE